MGAGWPDYPWLFGTDGEYTAFPMVALGQFEAIEDHMTALREASDIVNGRSGKVGHEFVSDGSMWFGQNADPGNTDETTKFPSAVALIWRWTGDNRFRDEMYDFTKRNMRYVVRELDEDGDGWPEGLGNVERSGMGPEKLDNTVYFIRGLYDLADLARSKHDGRTYAWARNLARRVHRRFEADVVDGGRRACTPTRSASRTRRSSRSTGSRSTPMEAELTVRGRPVPGLTTFDHGTRSLALHETPCFSGERPFNRGLFHTGCGGGPDRRGRAHDLRAEHGDPVGRRGQLRAARASSAATRRPRSSRCSPSRPPAACPTSSPVRCPRSCPSPEFGKNIDRCWTCRAMFIQAWGHYGSAWPVVHQHLGVRPDVGRGRLEVIPQLPSRAADRRATGSGSATATSGWCGPRAPAAATARPSPWAARRWTASCSATRCGAARG